MRNIDTKDNTDLTSSNFLPYVRESAISQVFSELSVSRTQMYSKDGFVRPKGKPR
jgi:hypothetical protein